MKTSFGHPQKISGNGIPDRLQAAIDRSGRDGCSLSDAQARITLDETPGEELPAELREARRARDEYERKGFELDQQEAAALAVNEEWHTCRTVVTNLEGELRLAESQREQLQELAADRPQVFGDRSFDYQFGIRGVLENFTQVAAARLALESLKKWLEKKRRELSEAVRTRDEFARKHAIGNLAPVVSEEPVFK